MYFYRVPSWDIHLYIIYSRGLTYLLPSSSFFKFSRACSPSFDSTTFQVPPLFCAFFFFLCETRCHSFHPGWLYSLLLLTQLQSLYFYNHFYFFPSPTYLPLALLVRCTVYLSTSSHFHSILLAPSPPRQPLSLLPCP